MAKSPDRVTTEAVLRQLVRDEMNRRTAAERRDPEKPSTTKWLSNRPPPIGDADDDSPGLGLMLGEAAPEKRGPPPSSLDDSDPSPPAPAAPASAPPQDDAAALKVLAAAGIRCDKNADAGLVNRVDGSFKMTDELVSQVAKLHGLVELKLSFSEVTDAGLAHIKNLTGMKELALNQTKITDAGLVHFEKLVNLEKLDLEKTPVTDACLERLKDLKQLQHLDLRGTKLSSAGVDSLKKAFPTARIRH